MLVALLMILAGLPGQPASPYASDSVRMHVDWRWEGGGAWAVAARAGIMYAGSGRAIIAVRDSNPVWVTVLGGACQSILIEDTLMYVAAGKAGLVVLSIADPVRPKVIGGLDVPGYAWCFAKDGPHGFIASGEFGLSAIDLSDPAHPSLRATAHPVDTITTISAGGGALFATLGARGLLVLDTRGPGTFGTATVMPMPDTAIGVTCIDSFAYVCCGDSGVAIVVADDPTRPRNVRRVDWPGARAVGFSETTAVVACGGSGAYVVNVANRSDPRAYCYLAVPGFALAAAVRDSLLAVGCGTGDLFAYNIRVPIFPFLTGRLSRPGYVGAIAVRDSIAWAATTGRLRALDLGSTSAQEIGSCPLPWPAAAVALGPDYVAVALRDSGLGIVDITDPSAPVRTGAMKTHRPALSVAAMDSWVFVGLEDSGVYQAALSAAREPEYRQSLPGLFSINHLLIEDTLLVAAGGDSGVAFWSIVDPAQPRRLGRVVLSGSIRGVAVRDTLCAACGDSGVFLFDVRRLGQPLTAQRLPLVATAWDIVICDSLLYVAADWAGVICLDIATPAYWWAPGYYGGPTAVKSVVLDGTAPLMADVYTGLARLQLDTAAAVAEPAVRLAPTTPLISAIAVPPYVSVSVRADDAAATVSLYDASGRRVGQSSVDASRSWQTVSFDTDPLGAGVFFARVDYGNTSQTVKIQLVR